jgi:hypothetical protein
MQVRPTPVAFADVELRALEGVLKSLALATLFAGGSVFSSDLLEVVTDHAGEGGIAVDGDFAKLFDELLVERESDIHAPIIRENLKLCKRILLKIR